MEENFLVFSLVSDRLDPPVLTLAMMSFLDVDPLARLLACNHNVQFVTLGPVLLTLKMDSTLNGLSSGLSRVIDLDEHVCSSILRAFRALISHLML